MPGPAEELERLMRGHTDAADEARILELLAAATATDLCAMLLAIDIAALLSDVDDRRGALLELLCGGRLADLSVPVRAALVTALHRGRTSAAEEAAIRAVLLGTSGHALCALKLALDGGGDDLDLQELVYGQIGDAAARTELLAHFAREAAAVAGGRLRVLSDIDDTLYARWKDSRYPPKTVYPGVRQLYRELAGEEDVVFLTARPADPAGLVERLTFRTLRGRGISSATVLTGSFGSLHSNERIAGKKLENFLEYAALYPEHRFVFLGDSGQGDAVFGAAMREREPERVRGVFIHDVVATTEDERRTWEGRGVLFFDSYVGAALHALRAGLLDADAARRVALSARSELEAVPFDDPRLAEARRAELDRDGALLEQELGG